MKLSILTPSFYDVFRCIADKCPYTCCKDWEIPVDEAAYSKYRELGIASDDSDCFYIKDGIRRIKRRSDGSCTYLDERGLCRLVSAHGEVVLCNTCAVFPRRISERQGVREIGLSNACPEVLRFLNETPAPLTFSLTETLDTEIGDASQHRAGSTGQDGREAALLQWRDAVIDILQIADFPLWIRLYIIYLCGRETDITNNASISACIAKYTSIPYLLELYQSLSQMECDLPFKIQSAHEIFYCLNIGVQKNETNYVKYIEALLDFSDGLSVEVLAADWKAYEAYIEEKRNFFENFCVNNMFVKGMHGSEGVIVLLIEYGLIRFSLFLQWLKNDKALTDEEMIGISAFYAKMIEHHDMQDFINIVNGIGDGDWLTTARIFTLIY